MSKSGNIIPKVLVFCLLFASAYILYEFVKKEKFVVKEIDIDTVTVNDTRYLTLKSNKIFNPSVEGILARVDENTIIINKHGEESSIEKGAKVLIEYEMGTLSNPPIVKANKIITSP